jgi:hypothetical protein
MKPTSVRVDFGVYMGVCGGVEEDRTPDLRIANATLSQLSYHPTEAAHFTANASPLCRSANAYKRLKGARAWRRMPR